MAYDYGKDVKSIIKRYETLKEDRILWEPFFRDVRDYIRPRKQNVDSSTHISASNGYVNAERTCSTIGGVVWLVYSIGASSFSFKQGA